VSPGMVDRLDEERHLRFVGRVTERDLFRSPRMHGAEWRAPFHEMKLVSGSYEGVGAAHIELRELLGRRIETRTVTVKAMPERRAA
jgi:hypothetical protein